jgi:drug/metabolite transporter (DMT)-like permease
MKWMAILFALGVALCWGLYGPALTLSRAPKGEWGPFKPYVFVGIAYLVIAVIGGALMMRFAFNDNFVYTGTYFPAMKWGFIAGALGALGALFLTIALTKAGGKPSYVMPIVFGGAVAVNAMVAYLNLHSGDSVNPLMWVGMALVCVGICLTTVYAPHAHPPAKPAAASPAVEVDSEAHARTSVSSNRSTG